MCPSSAKIWNKGFVLLTLINTFFCISLWMVGNTLSAYLTQLGASASLAGVIVSAYYIASIIFRPIAGPLLGRINGKLLISLAALAVIAGSVGTVFTNNYYIIFAFRILHGIGWSISSATVMTLASEFLPPGRLGEGIGYFGMSQIVAQAIATSIALAISNTYGYSVMLFVSASGAIFILLLLLPIKMNPPKTGAKLSLREIIAPEAIPPAMLSVLFGGVNSVVLTYIVLYGMDAGIGSLGSFFTTEAVFMFLCRFYVGKLVDRKSLTFMVVCFGLIIAVSMLFLGYGNSFFTTMCAAAIFGTGHGALLPTLQSAALKACPPERRGTASSTYFLGIDLGFVVGAVSGGALADYCGYSSMYLYLIPPILLGITATVITGIVKKRCFIKKRFAGEG